MVFVQQPVKRVYLSDAFVGVGPFVIQRNQRLGIVVTHGAQRGQLPIQRRRVVHRFADLVVPTPAWPVRDEVDLAAGALSDIHVALAAHQFEEHHVLEEASGVPHVVGAQDTSHPQVHGIVLLFLLENPLALDVVSVGRVEDERVVGRDRRRNGHGQRLGNGFYQQEILQSGWHIPPGFITALAHFCSLHAGVPRHVERKYR